MRKLITEGKGDIIEYNTNKPTKQQEKWKVYRIY